MCLPNRNGNRTDTDPIRQFHRTDVEDLGVSCRRRCRFEAAQPVIGVAGDSDYAGVLLPVVAEERVVDDESRGAIKRATMSVGGMRGRTRDLDGWSWDSLSCMLRMRL